MHARAHHRAVLHQDRHLVWIVAPLLKRELTPPRSHWGELGLLHPPPPSLVLAHGLTISAEAPDAWPYPEDPAELVVGSIWAFLNERWHTIPADLRARLTTAPLLLCGAAFVSPQRAFRSCPASCQPLFQPTAALSSVPAPAEFVLESLGVVAEPTLQHYTRLLRELPAECSGRRLSPPERRALLAGGLASDCD